MSQIPTPVNDDFANATAIGLLPFSDTQDLSAASTEPGEPAATCFGSGNSEWYSFTPATTQSVMATSSYGAGIAVYTGNSLSGLPE